MKKILPLLSIIVVAIGLSSVFRNYLPTQVRPLATVSEPATTKSAVSRGYKIAEVVRGLHVPWAVAFTGARRILLTERNGRIRAIVDGKLVERPVYTFPDVWENSEAGLLGLAVDPEYLTNKFIYASLTYVRNGNHLLKVVRLKDEGDKATIDKIILDKVEASSNHDGSRIKFGPDKKLYVTTGDATKKDLAQDLKSLNGKMLRLNSDGSVPSDNPTFGSAVYSYGHRNSQGFDWDSRNGKLWATEHGPSGFDGPGGGDEINLIKPGRNYGWPLVSHEKRLAGTEASKLLFTPAVAPSGAMFYKGDLLPQFKNNFFFAALRGEGIYRVVIDESKPEEAASFEKLAGIDLGRIREIVEGPDGAIYFSTSNTDGRGRERTGDDKIYKIVPNGK
ncbi:MAG: PQQ-dependent sugar dehydrogenase [Microgenomates group bacterium]